MMMFSWPHDNSAANRSHHSPHAHGHHGHVLNLLNALSFEHANPFHRKTKGAVLSHGTTPLPPPSPPPVVPPPRMPKEVFRRSSSRQSSIVRVHVNPILYGTLDPDGHVEDLFFDAHEFGDGHDDNSFATTFRRESVLLSGISVRGGAVTDASDETEYISKTSTDLVAPSSLSSPLSLYSIPPPPDPPTDLPLRFLRAGKGDFVEGMRRYKATLAWRKEHQIDTILRSPNPHIDLINQNFKSFIHLRGRQNEPCYYELPTKTNLKALQQGGITVPALLRHYTMVTEFLWQYIERDDLARSITIIDLEGIGLGDFVGDVVDFVRKASQFCGQHYPERAGYVYVINVPGWFKLIWNVVKPWVDEVTLAKIKILRGKDEIRRVMQERIPLEHIPPEYGGTSMPLGESPEEKLFAALVRHNNALANQGGGESCRVCTGVGGNPPCQFCSWVPARSY